MQTHLADQLLVRRSFSRVKLSNPLLIVDDGDQAIAYVTGEGKYADRETYPLPTPTLLDLKLPGARGMRCWNGCAPGRRHGRCRW